MVKANTQLEASGAEYLVLGHLLRFKIQSFITTQNYEDYDIVATNPEKNISIKIQVKSRFKESDTSFSITKYGAEIIIFVKLNCGRRKDGELTYEYRKEPEFYVFPMKLCKENKRKKGWQKVHIKDIENHEQYKDNWKPIKELLKL